MFPSSKLEKGPQGRKLKLGIAINRLDEITGVSQIAGKPNQPFFQKSSKYIMTINKPKINLFGAIALVTCWEIFICSAHPAETDQKLRLPSVEIG